MSVPYVPLTEAMDMDDEAEVPMSVDPPVAEELPVPAQVPAVTEVPQVPVVQLPKDPVIQVPQVPVTVPQVPVIVSQVPVAVTQVPVAVTEVPQIPVEVTEVPQIPVAVTHIPVAVTKVPPVPVQVPVTQDPQIQVQVTQVPLVQVPVLPARMTTAPPPVPVPPARKARAPPVPVPSARMTTVPPPVQVASPAVATPSLSTNSVVPNTIGFEDKNWYKIRSVGDNNVIQVDPTSKKLICMPEDSDKDDLQRFRSAIQPNGKFRILPKFQKSPTALQVWDFLMHRKLLVQMKESTSERFTQNFTSENVPGYHSLYLIQSGPSPADQKCLKNMGPGEQIQIVDKSSDSIGDHFMHWVLEIQDMPK